MIYSNSTSPETITFQYYSASLDEILKIITTTIHKNKSNKYELNKYEKNIQKNLTNKLSKDLIEYLYYEK